MQMHTNDRAQAGSVLVVDDEPLKRITLQASLGEAGWEVVLAANGREALQIVETRPVDAAVVDLKMPGMDGLELLERILALRPGTPVIVMTAYGSIETAVEAVRRGAVDFVTKPFHNEVMLQKLSKFVPAGRGGGSRVVRFGRIATCDAHMARMLEQAEKLATTSLPVAICGASGVGRKTLAAAMHEASRPSGKLVVVDAAVLSPEEIQLQFERLAGQAAGRDTVLVAEGHLLGADQQARLARLIAGRSGLGGDQSPRFLVTLSDRPERLAKAGRLDRNLAALLGAAVLEVPSLSQRRADMALLSSRILEEVSGEGARSISPAAMQVLCEYDWPGNINQLRAVLERAARLAASGRIEPRDLGLGPPPRRGESSGGGAGLLPIRLQAALDEVERELIHSALRQAKYNQARAAALLGVPRTTLRDKLAKHGFATKGPAG